MAAREIATFGGGCFWCLEAVFERIRGVEKVESGYAGGAGPTPTYEAVCSGRTGHAEVVQVTFDPDVVPYRTLVDVFFSTHDPTTKDRQGADVGTQYRSVAYWHSEAQKQALVSAIRALTEAKVFADPIVTEVGPAPEFFRAEAYHQGYYRNNPTAGYCRAVVAPKVAKLRASWAAWLKPGA